METVAITNAEDVFLQTPARVLLADDEPHILAALEILLRSEGYQTQCVSDPGNALKAVQQEKFDVVVMDLNYMRDTTGGGEGLELVSRIRSLDGTIPLVVMTAWSSVDLAVEALRRGASDFIQKPWNNSKLVEIIQEQVEHCRALRHSQRQQQDEEQEACEIQKSLLPRVIPNIPGYAISASTQQMRFVGGDYYDVVRISDSKTAFLLLTQLEKDSPRRCSYLTCRLS